MAQIVGRFLLLIVYFYDDICKDGFPYTPTVNWIAAKTTKKFHGSRQDLKGILQTIRNSLAHGGFKLEEGNGHFVDKWNGDHYELSISLEEMKKLYQEVFEYLARSANVRDRGISRKA